VCPGECIFIEMDLGENRGMIDKRVAV
jgi:hypothetical protein